MKPIELEVNDLPWAKAVTLWPFIFYDKGAKTPCIQLHEYYHWEQALRWGVLPWYMAYLLLQAVYFHRPPNEHPLEREAHRRQRACEEATRGASHKIT